MSPSFNQQKGLFGEGFETGCVGRLQSVDIDAPNVTHHILHDLWNTGVQLALCVSSLVAISPGVDYRGEIRVLWALALGAHRKSSGPRKGISVTEQEGLERHQMGQIAA